MNIHGIVAKHFNYQGSYKFFDIVEDLVERVFDMTEEDPDDEIWDAIDQGLIYYDDQWEVLKYYCTPQDANFNEALEELYNDIYEIWTVARGM